MQEIKTNTTSVEQRGIIIMGTDSSSGGGGVSEKPNLTFNGGDVDDDFSFILLNGGTASSDYSDLVMNGGTA